MLFMLSFISHWHGIRMCFLSLKERKTVKAYLFPQSECDMINTEDTNKLENSKLLPSQCLKLTLK